MGSSCGKNSASSISDKETTVFEEATKTFVHNKARTSPYPSSDPPIERLKVPDNLVPWGAAWKDYNPPSFTDSWVLGTEAGRRPSWADQDINPSSKNPPAFNSIDDGSVDRRSRCFGQNTRYEVVDGYPRNPMGRTGLQGRGRLGRWGPNHAADPIVTRWRRRSRHESISNHAGDQRSNDTEDCTVVKHPVTNKPILEFVAVLRNDTEEWAIPGGMVFGDEIVSTTLKRRFTEEALDALNLSDKEVTDCKMRIARFFTHGTKIFIGYVDDPRNTDNAWMETVAYNFHDDSGDAVGRLNFRAGIDTGAQQVRWMECSGDAKYFASHAQFLKKVAEIRGAHW